MDHLTLEVYPNGACYVGGVLVEAFEVARREWWELFGGEYVLELEAMNGEPMVYECCGENDDWLLFRRAQGFV